MKALKFLAIAVLVTALSSCNNQIANKKELSNDLDSISYALGLDMANKFKANLPKVNSAVFMQGYTNGMDSVNLLINNSDLEAVIQGYFQKEQQKKMKAQREEAYKKAEKQFAAVKKAGEDFLAANKTKKGVITTESGLQYIVVKKGTGAKPSATDKVKVHYHGTLLDGTVFDSSVDKKAPIEMGVNQFIKGWVEALQLMNVGSKIKLFVPQELAYGAFPRAGAIKPFMALVFEMELLDIIK